MKCFTRWRGGSAFSVALSVLAPVILFGATASAETKKSPRSKSASAKTTKAPAKTTAGAASRYKDHLAANLKLLNILSRYADALAMATNSTTATLALRRIEDATKALITAGDELVKLGRPDPEVVTKLAKDPDLVTTSRNVAEQTRSAVKAISANPEVKSVLTPSIENFQSALNRIQQAADDPQGPGHQEKTPDAAGPTETAKNSPPPSARAAPSVAGTGASPAIPASQAASVPPPPPPGTE
jgi:hypothetical protein